MHYETRVLAVVTELIHRDPRHAHACLKGYECCAKYSSSKWKLMWHDKRFVEELQFCYWAYNALKITKMKIFRRVRTTAKSDYYLRHVCPSDRMEQLGYNWTDFHEVLYLRIFRKSVPKIQVSLKSDEKEKRVLYMKTNIHFWSSVAHFLLQWNMFQTKTAEKLETQILCSITFFFSKIVAFMR